MQLYMLVQVAVRLFIMRTIVFSADGQRLKTISRLSGVNSENAVGGFKCKKIAQLLHSKPHKRE